MKLTVEEKIGLWLLLIMGLLIILTVPGFGQEVTPHWQTLELPIDHEGAIEFGYVFREAAVVRTQPTPLEDSSCKAQLPYGMPSPHDHVICRVGYVLDYDPETKDPVWDAHLLTPEHSIGCEPRSNAFAADQSLDAPRATPKDYLHSGYDIGHMSPDADFTYSKELERESFILTNMAPQLPGLNRQTWKYLEDDIRAWAFERNHPLWIVTGPIFSDKPKTIGADKVAVPAAFYKIVVDTVTHDGLVFTMPQKEGLGSDLGKYLTPMDGAHLARETGVGISFLGLKLDDTLWPVDMATYNAAKKSACK